MNDAILHDIRILDLCGGIAGSLATLLLAEAGAEVVKIEPTGGVHGRGSALFAVLNRSKKSIALDPLRDAPLFERLISGADVIVHDRTPAEAQALGLDGTALAARHPHLVTCAIGGFPRGHVYAELPPRDALVLAQAGICDEQPAVRREGPIFLRFALGSWCGAFLATAGILARLYHRRRGGGGGCVDTSLLQGALIPMLMHWNRAQTPTPTLAVGMPKRGAVSLFECSDGLWMHVMTPPDASPTMAAALARMGPEAVAAANAPFAAEPMAYVFKNLGANKVVIRTRPREYWLQEFWTNDISVQPALSMGELYFDQQSIDNGYVIDVEDPIFGRTRQPGQPLHVEPALRLRGGAPVLDGDRAAILASLDRRPASLPIDPALRGQPPLSGLKVLDFGSYLAGPLAPMLLGDLGAEVIKIEQPEGDAMRRGSETAFTGCQRGKASLALQLKDPAARPIVERLVRGADVLHHNMRMPAARKLGLDYDALKTMNPRLVYCHVSTYGPLGARRDWPGYDQMAQAQSGWEYEGAGEGNPPIWHRFGMTDHLGAMASLSATLLALYRREGGGGGQAVSASILGACMMTVSETIVGADGRLTPFVRLNGEQTRIAPGHGIYRCRDGWIALAALLPEELAALERCTGTQDAATLEAHFAAMDAAGALALLRGAGVPCARVTEDQRAAFLDDPAHLALGLVNVREHPVYGRFMQPGAAWNLGPGIAAVAATPPPTIGQHSRAVLASLGFDSAAIDALIAAGTVRESNAVR
ncbi:MAG: CoA transferase [Gammaproteobacteria bacterium]